ncbi:MAG: sensor histidine kinase [Thermomicrobiales bacterium]
MSIKTRLTVAVTLVVMVVLTVLGVVLVRSTRATLVDQVDYQVVSSASRAKGGPPHDSGGPDKNQGGQGGQDGQGGYGSAPTSASQDSTSDWVARPVAYFVYSSTGKLLEDHPCGYPDDPNSPPRLPTIPSSDVDALVDHIVTTPAVDGSLHYRTLVQRSSSGEYLVTAAPLSEAESAVSHLMKTLIIAGAGALIVAILASWWLIWRDLRPVDQMVDTAAAIAAGDLSRRVPSANPRTELGRLGRALNDMLTQIEEAVRARTASEERLRRFIADAAHELRTPLTSLRGYAELYRQGAIPDQTGVSNAMGRIESEGARMARLVDDMLLLARLDQQRGLESKPVDVVELVREAVADFQTVDPARPLTVALAKRAVVSGDPVRLRQVVDNLLTNVRIHTPPATPAHVTVANAADHVEIAVADEGPGIDPSDRERIFERFWRADAGRSRSRGGTGLGLAIVASLVHAHGGTITVASDLGHGTTFTVQLPLAQDGANS